MRAAPAAGPGLPLLLVAVVVGVAAGLVVDDQSGTRAMVGSIVALADRGVRVARLHVTSMARWALARTFGS